MRESDRLLGDDLEQAGAPDLASRARAGEFNEYFGDHDHAQAAIVWAVQDEPGLRTISRERLICWVLDGKYTASQEEEREWADRADGRRGSTPPKSPRT